MAKSSHGGYHTWTPRRTCFPSYRLTYTRQFWQFFTRRHRAYFLTQISREDDLHCSCIQLPSWISFFSVHAAAGHFLYGRDAFHISVTVLSKSLCLHCLLENKEALGQFSAVFFVPTIEGSTDGRSALNRLFLTRHKERPVRTLWNCQCVINAS